MSDNINLFREPDEKFNANCFSPMPENQADIYFNCLPTKLVRTSYSQDSKSEIISKYQAKLKNASGIVDEMNIREEMEKEIKAKEAKEVIDLDKDTDSSS